ncbi:hypothetical protein RJ641_035210 [Dillenia turbinata]|uniref:Uncharacterized protein n=1 Tax=Dillenia turbinata TaxID=194707 RepID=A0AAN8ZI09_9MAGN
MASSSPALSNNSTDTANTTATTGTASAAAAAAAGMAAIVAAASNATATSTPPRTLRGLNKPKCIKCGNVARSRTSIRASSLRQLSNNFAQFNSVQVPFRSKKPLTRKDAAAINEWRFSKLKEFRERNIEAENEAFDRYMRNISLLEEVFSVKSIPEEPPIGKSTKLDTEPHPNPSLYRTSVEDNEEVFPVKSMPEKPQEDGSSKLVTEPNSNSSSNPTSIEDNAEGSPVRSAPKQPPKDEPFKSYTEPNPNPNPRPTAVDNFRMAFLGHKVKLRSNPVGTDRHRRGIQHIVEHGLIKLQGFEFDHSGVNVSEQSDNPGRSKKVKTWREERASLLSDLTDKLNKAQNEEDLEACSELKAQLFDENSKTHEIESKDMQTAMTEDAQNNFTSRQESACSSFKLFRKTEIDRENLNRINEHFSSLEHINL